MSTPQSSPTMPRMKMAAPMVMMMRLTTEALLAGRMASVYRSAPIAVEMSIERGMEQYIGIPTESRSMKEIMPPSMTNSPCAKLMILVTA